MASITPNDLYSDLGVSPDATPEEIKKAGRDAAKRNHPDRGGQQENFVRCQNALKVLSDPQRRAEYDRTGNADPSSPEESEKAEAASLLAKAMNEVMGHGEPRFNHLPKLVRGKMDEAKRSIADQIAQASSSSASKSKVLDDYLKRLTKSGGGPDMIRSMLEAQKLGLARDTASTLARLERSYRIVDRALALLEGYDYVVDANQQGVGAYGQSSALESQMDRVIRDHLRRQGGVFGRF